MRKTTLCLSLLLAVAVTAIVMLWMASGNERRTSPCPAAISCVAAIRASCVRCRMSSASGRWPGAIATTAANGPCETA